MYLEEDLDEEIRPLFHSLVTVTVPVMTGDEKIGSLSIVVKKRRRVERSIGDFLEELAKMFFHTIRGLQCRISEEIAEKSGV